MSIKRVGVIGGGQLAWMMAQQARSLGLELIVQTPSYEDPAVERANEVVLGAIDDAAATAELARRCEVITFENEFVNLKELFPLAQQGVDFRPRLENLAPLLDKYEQRRFLQKLGLPVPQFQAISGEIDASWGFPLVLKARRHGYDGQGTFILRDRQDLETFGAKRSPLLLEEYIPFERELAVMAARGETGEIAIYPAVETQQEKQVCRRVLAPAAISETIERQIEQIARTFLEGLEAVGIFGIELFLTAAGEILINEIAPRTHNSGHFTLDACETSQFAMQLQAVAGLSLGSTQMKCAQAVMVNLLGYEHAISDYAEKRAQLSAIPRARVYWYGKSQAHPGRKLGHVTVLMDENSDEDIAGQIESLWYA